MKIKNLLLLFAVIISALSFNGYQLYTKYYVEPRQAQTAATVNNKSTKVQYKNKITEKEKSFETVDDDYFCDALFIGDSRMVGLSRYCEPIDTRATFYAKESLTIYNIQNDPWIEDENGEEKTLWDMLSTHEFKKIYIMVGINEIGTKTDVDYSCAYTDVINRIMELEPEAMVFINSIMHVTKEKSDSDALYNNTNIEIRNNAIKPLADNRHIFYININDYLDDETGSLNSEYTTDGVHLKGACYEPWHQALLEHGVKID
ncbi:MAG: hypothetical protein K6E79_05535 [Pseudobutyrivibrio sp.]|nr:hypothetical protein [Pseudobutyrivibrio sp.]